MKRIPVIIFGAGGVGRALLRQIVDGRIRTIARNQCRFDVVAIADSKSWLWQPDGMDNELILETAAAKEAGQPVDPARRGQNGGGAERPSPLEIINHAHTAGLQNAIVVDVTAENGMEPMIDRALELGYGIALANKKLFAGPWATAQAYFNHRQIRHESTVGGGQPVIATLRYLLDTNDPIYRIEGQLSGTLGYLCQQLDKATPFSQALADAKARGYTEPDPREDLGGQDVMRKVLILGRMAGWPLAADELVVESLYPAAMAGLSVADFMARSAELDAAMAARVSEAAAQGNVLRYVAELEDGNGRIGLKAIPASSPLANLKYISFRTERYHDEPLLIGGKGAGVEMTAAGVVGDMVDLVREIF